MGPSTTECIGNAKEGRLKYTVLQYYNLQEEITLQHDACQSGLGAAMLQGGQHVVYA